MSLRALNALHFGQNLQYIDLRGVSGLTQERITQLEGALRRKQCKNIVQPEVTIRLPSLCLSKAEACLETQNTLRLPNIHRLSPDFSGNKLVIKK